MANDITRAFATGRLCLVVAAAGCGKTELIADAVTSNQGRRQLVLTHTHAGVRAILDRLRKKKANPSSFRVDTIAGFALRYAASFPAISKCSDLQPTTSEEWLQVYKGAVASFKNRNIRTVFDCSYSDLYVDEYQDCSLKQHELIMMLSEITPTHIVGDPLQGIFGFQSDDPLVNWSTDIIPHFDRLPDLETPYRWQQNNVQLGAWLLEARASLLSGKSIQINDSESVKWVQLDSPRNSRAKQISTCLNLLKHRSDSIAVIRKWPQEARSTSKLLSGRFRAMEEVECKDLLDWCSKLEATTGIERARVLIDGVLVCVTKKPRVLAVLSKSLNRGELPGSRVLKDHELLKNAIYEVAQCQDISSISRVLQLIMTMPDVILHRKELFSELLKASMNVENSADKDLRTTAWRIRDGSRKYGRFVDPRVVSRTTLVKGLEFDHVVIADADDFDDAQNLYVALTRGSKSLTVLSNQPFLKRKAPEFLLSL